MKIVFLTFIIFGSSELVQCANIFAAITTPFYSHQATFRPLWRELAKKGHKITLVTTHPMETNENITQLDYSDTYSDEFMETTLKISYNPFKIIKTIKSNMDKILTKQYTHPGLLELVQNNKTFDLMMIELIMPGWPVLSVKFKCPFIGLSTMDGHQQMHRSVGNAIHPAIYPYADLGIGDDFSIRHRFMSTALVLFYDILNKLFSLLDTSLLRSFIDENLPDALEVQRNVSLIFVNSNPVFFPPRPVTPATINLGGGLHLTQPKKLPQNNVAIVLTEPYKTQLAYRKEESLYFYNRISDSSEIHVVTQNDILNVHARFHRRSHHQNHRIIFFLLFIFTYSIF